MLVVPPSGWSGSAVTVCNCRDVRLVLPIRLALYALIGCMFLRANDASAAGVAHPPKPATAATPPHTAARNNPKLNRIVLPVAAPRSRTPAPEAAGSIPHNLLQPSRAAAAPGQDTPGPAKGHSFPAADPGSDSAAAMPTAAAAAGGAS